jgi:hypothetical protein
MKKFLLIAAIIFVSGMSGLYAQRHRNYINPIPSYNYPVTNEVAAFQEKLNHGNPLREKRDMDVVISSSSSSPMLIFAQVWVVKDAGSVILGPFIIYPDDQLSVPIDNGQWGVVIKSEWDITASVWID